MKWLLGRRLPTSSKIQGAQYYNISYRKYVKVPIVGQTFTPSHPNPLPLLPYRRLVPWGLSIPDLLFQKTNKGP